MTIKLIGMQDQKNSALSALKNRLPVLFYGFTGNGKTLLAREVAETYAKENNLDIIYLQLYPEMTKNSLIGGETLKDGSIVIEKQPLINFGTKGAVFIIDECTHTTEPVLLAFNSLIEAPYSTVVGNEIIVMNDKTRFIFCGNLPDHTGNISLPTSFANRLFIVKTELLSKTELMDLGRIVNPEVPNELLDLVSKIIIDTHDPSFPISPRNMVTFCSNYASVKNTGYDSNAKINGPISTCCRRDNLNPNILKQSIISSLMGHVVFKTDGPKKVQALLW